MRDRPSEQDITADIDYLNEVFVGEVVYVTHNEEDPPSQLIFQFDDGRTVTLGATPGGYFYILEEGVPKS